MATITGTQAPPTRAVEPSSAPDPLLPAMARATGNSSRVAGDMLHLAGVTTEDGAPTIQPVNTAAVLGINAGVAGGMAVHQRSRLALTGTQTAAEGARQFALNGVRITPTLVSAVAGPAIADGVTWLAPKRVPQYNDDMTDNQKLRVQVLRGATGGVAVALLAGVAWLVRPQLFQRAGFMSEHVIENVARDATFSNRVALGAVGGGASLYATNRAADSTGEARRGWAIAAGVTSAATVVGMGAAGRATERIGLLQANRTLFKPNAEWFKEYASKIAPVTVIPAGAAASQYFNIVSDFDQITGTRSPWRDD